MGDKALRMKLSNIITGTENNVDKLYEEIFIRS